MGKSPVTKKRGAKSVARKVAYEVLDRVLRGGAYSNLALRGMLSSVKLSGRDRGMVTLLVLGVLRNLTLIDSVFRSKATKGSLSSSPQLLLIARMAVFEILFTKKVPGYATVSEYVSMSEKLCSAAETRFLNACLRRVKPNDPQRVMRTVEDPVQRTALEFSHPEWYVRASMDAFGETECLKMLRANNTGAPAYYRVNTARVTEQEIMELFLSLRLDVQSAPNLPGCIYVKTGQNFSPDREYTSGILTPQDYSTQIVAHAVAPQPGESVLDLCCGRGTKAAHLAELMGGGGRVLAVDKFPHKIAMLEQEKQRLHLDNIECLCADALELPDVGIFDRVLVDAPCTGTGTFRRRPEIKLRVRPQDVAEMSALQKKLLDAAATRVRPGGRLVYATCSTLTEENDDVIDAFLRGHTEFSMDRDAFESYSIPCVRTPFGRIFLPHQILACAIAVFALRRGA